MHKPNIKFDTVKPSSNENHHYKITMSLNDNLKLKMLAMKNNDTDRYKYYLKDFFKELMKIGSYPVIIDNELNVNPIDKSGENKQWKINAHQIISEFLDRFRLKLIGVPNYKYDLDKIKEKVKESTFRYQIFYYLDEFNITHLMVHVDRNDLLDQLLVSCLKEIKTLNYNIRRVNDDIKVSLIGNNFDDKIRVITIKDDEDNDNDNDEIESNLNEISFNTDCSNILIEDNEDSNSNYFTIHNENDDSQKRRYLVTELEELNKDKNNQLYYLNQLIIDNYYRTSKRPRNDSISD
jgi:hypothetical protein